MANAKASPSPGAGLLAAGLLWAGCLDRDEAEPSLISPYGDECDEGLHARLSTRSASAPGELRYLAKLSSGGDPAAKDPLERLGVRILAPHELPTGPSDLFEYIELDGVAEPAAQEVDPRMVEQWHLPAVCAPQAWTCLDPRNAVAVAVVDSGVFGHHPDLDGRILPGMSFLTGTSDTLDVLGHGTSVAGAAAAVRGNGVGVAGMSPSPILPLVVLDSGGFAWYSDIARALVHAADLGVRVINVSIGGETASRTLQNAVTYAWKRGCLVVASAMNHGGTDPRYPAACEHALAVGAVDPSGQLASFSGRGSWIDLVAPGVSILTTVGVRCYDTRHGTSFAAPLVAGVAAMVLAVRPELSAGELVHVLTSTCDDLGPPGIDDLYGAGRVNAMRALQRSMETEPADR